MRVIRQVDVKWTARSELPERRFGPIAPHNGGTLGDAAGRKYIAGIGLQYSDCRLPSRIA
jgi:hypothetical protein